MTDKLLLWPLLFDGQLHYAGRDPVELVIAETPLHTRGAGWWGRMDGDGHATTESEQDWLYDLWKRNERF
jgi:hypothetical protein